MRPPPPPPKYVLGCIALTCIVGLYGGRKAVSLESGYQALGFFLAVSLAGLVVAYASWYLGMHRKFRDKTRK